MDPTQFARLVRALTRPASRRTTLAALLGGALAGRLARVDAAAPAQRRARQTRERSAKDRPCPPGQKLCHGQCLDQQQPCGQPGGGCRANGQACQQDRHCCSTHCANDVCAPLLSCAAENAPCQQNSDCCSANCFQQACAANGPLCGGQACPPGATGCCAGTCCQPPANQCNTTSGVALCCAPNCAGRECGDDGCGNGGKCGTCPSGQTCSAKGKCQGQPTCSRDTCPHGCCDARGVCQPGTTEQACGTNGQACRPCPGSTSTCQNGQCVVCTDVCPCSGQSACRTPNAPNAYCAAGGLCYCAVTRAGVPVCASGALQVRGGCQTDQDCVDAVAGAYCIDGSNLLQSPCIFGQAFCASPCNPAGGGTDQPLG